MTEIKDLKVELFADGASIEEISLLAKRPEVKGFTTNPSLMRKAGVQDYTKFAKEVLKKINHKLVSFEVFSDDLEEMLKQGREISRWGNNVCVKIPVTNSYGIPTNSVIETLSLEGIKVNVTAIMTINQVTNILQFLSKETLVFLSVFAGRIADTGIDPIPMIEEMLALTKNQKNIKFIWASPRELLNIIQANNIGCHIITATKEILDKLELLNKNLDQYSLETVKMFQNDAQKSGYKIVTR